jgi:hypothetical protein
VSAHTHASTQRAEEELTQCCCRWKGKSRSPRFSRGRHCNEAHSVRASCGERLGKYFRGNFPNLCEQGGVTAYDFFATAVMGSDDPTDGGECRLELRHGNLDKSEELGVGQGKVGETNPTYLYTLRGGTRGPTPRTNA